MTGRERAKREKSWGVRLYERRKALGITQAQLAELSEVTQQAISKIETNPAAVPRIYTIEAIARALGTNVEELFPWESRPRQRVAS